MTNFIVNFSYYINIVFYTKYILGERFMLKKLLKTVCVMVILTILATSISFAETSKKSIKDMPYDLEYNEALKQLNESNDLDIFILGNNKDTISKKGNNFIKMEDIKDISSSKQYKSIWLEESFYEPLLNNNIKLLDEYLDKGYSIYFLGLQDLNVISEKFTGQKSYETINDGNVQKAAFVTKNMDGEYFFGHFFSDNSYKDDDFINSLRSSTWNRRNDRNYTRKHKTESALSKILTNVAYANSGNSFSIGSSWSQKVSWSQYNFDVGNLLPSIKAGSYTEWKAAYYLTNSSDGKDYYALVMESCMDPNSSGSQDASSDYLNIYSDLKLNKSGQLLKSYAPTQSPSTSTYSFNIGSSLGKTSSTANIGASWSTSVSELELLDSSQPSGQITNIKFNYKWPNYMFTSYSTNTSWQSSSIICQLPAGSTYACMNNKRTACFATKYSILTTSTTQHTRSQEINTYIYK